MRPNDHAGVTMNCSRLLLIHTITQSCLLQTSDACHGSRSQVMRPAAAAAAAAAGVARVT